ncbi:hypothetical protein [Bradyrhizobium erythrophlei]|uniref:Uncharacterized protein n=1 Tax=Bradyrhizobium erythrophlei TaxID=1437360 RepID=A0A1H5A292_9BRAD|nr:hypothetical protein [Bradyrhizobium erythrophlei]SED36469.1 hypothetical protein SAMN05444164_4551 [Bradyrhizobium erythrophlei]
MERAESAIVWYGNGRFNAADMRRATGLSERSQRELLKLGILQAVPQSRTATRLFDSRMLKRAALIYPLHEHGGLNLQVSGKLVYANTLLESLLYDSIDPWHAHQRMVDKAPHGEREWNWFSTTEDPGKEPGDFYVSLINRYFIASGFAASQHVYGHLTDDGSDIIVFRDAVWDELIDRSGTVPDGAAGQFHPKSALAGKSRIFKSRTASELERDAIKRVVDSPTSIFSVNASLTLRVALRKLLRISGAS